MHPKEKLAILVPDGAYPLVLSTILNKRRASLNLRRVDFEIIKDAYRDSSQEVVALLRPYLRSCTHVLLVRDLHGSGWEDRGPEALQEHLTEQLLANGWTEGKSCVLVVAPEIEAWLRFDSVHLHDLVRERARRMRKEADLLFASEVERVIGEKGGTNTMGKPIAPKEVLEKVLELFGVQRSNSLYERLAGVESLRHCKVESFQRLVSVLQQWFPAA